jgi:hypothetical protein
MLSDIRLTKISTLCFLSYGESRYINTNKQEIMNLNIGPFVGGMEERDQGLIVEGKTRLKHIFICMCWTVIM